MSSLSAEVRDDVGHALIVKPIKTKTGKGKKPLGYELFPQLAASIYISAGTKSGKTTLISHILDQCVGSSTTVFIFAPTVYIDATYKHIIQQLDKRNIKHFEYVHFIDENGNNILSALIDAMIAKSAENAPDERKIKSMRIENKQVVYEYYDMKPKVKAEPELTEPKYFLIFDDLGEEMRNKSIYKWLKMQRQFFAKTILSSQAINNLMPNSIGQLDYVCVFGGQREESIIKLKNKLDLPNSDEDFLALYRYATREKYHFLYIDRREVLYRKDFNEPLKVIDEDD